MKNKCNCEPKLYHWADCASPILHGYFYGCKEHNLRTSFGTRKDLPMLKQDWEENYCFEGDSYLEEASEVEEESK